MKMQAKSISKVHTAAQKNGKLDSMGNVPSLNNDRVRTSSFADRGRHMAFGVVDPKFLNLSFVRSPWELKANFTANAIVDTAGAFKEHVVSAILILLFKYCFVLLIGVVFFMNHDGEAKLQKEEAGEEMDFITTLFWTSVIASTVGYGHKLHPRHDDTKLFLTFYFWVACITVAGIISDLSKLYLRYTEQQIVDKIFDSMIWVHKSDLHDSKKVSQSEYVLFKLRQLNDIDDVIIQRLTVRFTELDLENKGMLKIGLHVPNAQQVKQMLQTAKTTGREKELHSMWLELRPTFVNEDIVERGLVRKESSISLSDLVENESERTPKKVIRLIGCHKFDWSRRLWREAMRDTAALGSVLLLIYITAGIFVVRVEGWPAEIGFYVLALTISTVGLGDVAPTKDLSRIGAIIGIPFGLVILGVILSISVEYGRSLPPVLKVEEDEREAQKRAVFEALDLDRNCELDLDEVLKGSASLGLTRDQAQELFIMLDADQNGKLVMSTRFQTSWLSTVPGRIFVIAMRLYIVVFFGAIMLLYIDGGASRGVTWIDALYFATVVATSVGYGDLTTQTIPGQIVMGFFVLISTLITAGVLRDFAEVYVRDYEGEKIVRDIIESSTWVYKADINKSGIITESDYVLFKLQQLQMVSKTSLDNLVDVSSESDYVLLKLQQLQMVSKTSLDNLVDRFFELDITNDGFLDVGVDCPSGAQVNVLTSDIIGTTMTMAGAWRKKQAGLIEYEMKVRRANGFAQKWKRQASVEGKGEAPPQSRHPSEIYDGPLDLKYLEDKEEIDKVDVVAQRHRPRFAAEEISPAGKTNTIYTDPTRPGLETPVH
eukprot:CAMPEP_0171779476 /NCGR_PEP_ID=MMETSP0991-20121206/59033_1 /TAXON_ID=483369 /ORGANISM="non described non described, Strain CCMP2098" /LENGTH=826 /DNA_ID=CAMNT_0012386655 /DNA_START=314 /DNA_END=2795 /DNA_ORIENTATION=-